MPAFVFLFLIMAISIVLSIVYRRSIIKVCRIMKFFLSFLVSLLLFNSCKHEQHGPEYEKRLKLAEQQVDKIMEMMDLPEYGLVKMSKEGLYLTKDYSQAAADMMLWGRKMKDLDHPDKKFMEFDRQMQEAFDLFETALKSRDKDQIAGAWKVVAKSCKDCHDVYD